ncbi:hypothetical protein DFP72DRAFT_1093177 [Ephemerocybe angulata]|uniref:Uncharacterized protein n=1 Tax=Ephemerocybe angulata TaxID=980116 RepID=A0A8H6LXI2_9AGAR|nr:hypothetical protein DFP72DRAFT_1093177 [Tulosesus angulatus]
MVIIFWDAYIALFSLLAQLVGYALIQSELQRLLKYVPKTSTIVLVHFPASYIELNGQKGTCCLPTAHRTTGVYSQALSYNIISDANQRGWQRKAVVVQPRLDDREDLSTALLNITPLNYRCICAYGRTQSHVDHLVGEISNIGNPDATGKCDYGFHVKTTEQFVDMSEAIQALTVSAHVNALDHSHTDLMRPGSALRSSIKLPLTMNYTWTITGFYVTSCPKEISREEELARAHCP